MLFGRSRRGSAAGLVAIMVAIMAIATVVSGAIIYYSRGGVSPSVGLGSSGSGLSGALSNADLANLTSALGQLSGNLSNPALANLTSSFGGLSNPSLTNLTSSLQGLSGSASNSTLANFTVSLSRQVAVTASSLPAEDFTANGTSSTFTCAPSPSGAYLTLANNGTSSESVASVSIASGGNVTTFTASGACTVPSGSGGTTDVIFPTTSMIASGAVSGSYYLGVVTLSDGTQVLFEGAWQ